MRRHPHHAALPEHDGFKLTPARLEAAITARTRWLILNSPSNPTGASYTLDEYRALADVLARHPHVLVMTDDIYEHIRFDTVRTPHLLNAALNCATARWSSMAFPRLTP